MIHKTTRYAIDGTAYTKETQVEYHGIHTIVEGITRYYVNNMLVDYWEYIPETGQFKVIPLSEQSHE